MILTVEVVHLIAGYAYVAVCMQLSGTHQDTFAPLTTTTRNRRHRPRTANTAHFVTIVYSRLCLAETTLGRPQFRYVDHWRLEGTATTGLAICIRSSGPSIAVPVVCDRVSHRSRIARRAIRCRSRGNVGP
jgi:hypothetical protein